MKKLSYQEFWEQKGEYGRIRFYRMLARKEKRHKKAIQRRKERARSGYGTYWFDESGRKVQWCEWPEGSICEYPCNGDC